MIKLYKYRITKYNPLFRNDEGRYLVEDWIAVSDIGSVFNGKELTMEEYKKTEDSYIAAIKLIMEYLNIPYLRAADVIRSFPLEMFKSLINDYNELYSDEMMEYYSSEKGNYTLTKEKVDFFCRLLLREDIGATIYYNRKMKVFIGYDYLMGVHTSKSLEPIVPVIHKLGLFVEDFSS